MNIFDHLFLRAALDVNPVFVLKPVNQEPIFVNRFSEGVRFNSIDYRFERVLKEEHHNTIVQRVQYEMELRRLRIEHELRLENINLRKEVQRLKFHLARSIVSEVDSSRASEDIEEGGSGMGEGPRIVRV